jgi:hypothetical protein
LPGRLKIPAALPTSAARVPSWYGTIAEIGAGQEVGRWFFAVGGAAGTVAKTISAYDMTVSDGIYGKSHRYVSRERLEQMLDLEYTALLESLAPARGDATSFFVFVDTAAMRSYSRREERGGMARDCSLAGDGVHDLD